MSADARLEGADAIRSYVFAGNATFTVVSKVTGARRTFRLREAPNGGGSSFFASMLTGPDNGSDYRYLGFVFRRGGMAVPATARGGTWTVKPNRTGWAPDAVATLDWILRQLEGAGQPGLAQAEVWHTGRCGRCGRLLTVPESVAAGIGPDCAGRMAA